MPPWPSSSKSGIALCTEFQLINIVFMVGVTSQLGLITPPNDLIPTLVFR
jgi:hypothetical protein